MARIPASVFASKLAGLAGRDALFLEAVPVPVPEDRFDRLGATAPGDEVLALLGGGEAERVVAAWDRAVVVPPEFDLPVADLVARGFPPTVFPA
ncbi:MAG: hypothetical protein H0U16_11950 [Actinobacteria bacterium]|nr:hypothetical protein [Actinomycetota bacterium]